MALAEHHVRQTTTHSETPNSETVETTRSEADPVLEDEHKRTVASRVVWYVAGVLLALLGIRFLLAMLGANTGSGFVSFIYAVTYPFVAPFFGVFGYNFTAGQARFEVYTLLAMLIYALIAYGIARLTTLTSRHAEV
jgi:FtsH-binding integral membrane protein